MKTTQYFDRDVRIPRPYLRDDWIERVLTNPLETEVQENGRIRRWGIIEEGGGKIPRVVTLSDGVTVHNAFFDRGYKP